MIKTKSERLGGAAFFSAALGSITLFFATILAANAEEVGADVTPELFAFSTCALLAAAVFAGVSAIFAPER